MIWKGDLKMACTGCTDLISRSALLAEYDRVHVGEPGGARKLIAEAPAVDAEPVRRGEWKVTVCSLCRHDLDGWTDGAHEEVADGNVHYCPNCGARMNGGKQDDNDI